MNIRRCPIPFSDAQRGTCRWCGEEITKDGKRNNRARWHPSCLDEYMLHSNREAQLEHLTRTGIPCECCGRAIPQFKPHGRRLSPDGLHYTEIVRRFAGHIDHKVPLWKVTHVEELERIKYFGPGNLQILCEKCHAIKTAREASERAHYTRLAQKSAAQKGKPSKRVMRSRGFSKIYKRKLNGQVIRRA